MKGESRASPRTRPDATLGPPREDAARRGKAVAAESAGRVASDGGVGLDALVESYLGGVVAMSPAGDLLRLNRGAEEILGVRRGEVRNAPDLLARARPEDECGRAIPLERTPFGRARLGEQVRETLLSIRRPDGSRRWLIATAAPVGERDRVSAVVVGFMDVTGRRDLCERRARAPGPHSRFRTGGPGGASTATLPAALLQQLERAYHLESGHVPVELEAVDLKASILDLLERLRASGDVARVRLELASETPRARADPAHLDTITASLLDNALKYAPATTEVVIACRGEGDGVVIEVRDAGPGIEPRDAPHLFDRFYRGGTAGAVEGLGLGLYMVRRLAEAQGGTVTVRSEPGKGSTFAVRLAAWSTG